LTGGATEMVAMVAGKPYVYVDAAEPCEYVVYDALGAAMTLTPALLL
jgi:hypothetical protein